MLRTTKADFLSDNRTFHVGHRDVVAPLFQENDFFDPRDLLQVKYEMLRQVRVDKVSVSAASASFALSRACYYEALGRWQQHGILALLPNRPGPRDPHKLTPAVMAAMHSYIANHERWDGADLVEYLWIELGVRVHQRTLEKALRGSKGG